MLDISVIIPVYNRQALLRRALNSVLNQDIPLREIIVVDDYSEEDICGMVGELAAATALTRMTCLRNDRNRGSQFSRNRGIRQAVGTWVILLDSDNELYPEYSSSIAPFLNDGRLDVITHFSQIVDDSGQDSGLFDWVCEGRIESELLQLKAYADNSSATIRKQRISEIGLLDEDCPSYQEWDTHIRLAEISAYHTIARPLTTYYLHGGERISGNIGPSIRGKLYVLKKHRRKWLEKLGAAAYRKSLKGAFYEFSGQLPLRLKVGLVFRLARLDVFFPFSLAFYWIGYKLGLHD